MNQLITISRKLCDACNELHFSAPVATVYNPLEYARKPHEAWLSKYGAGKKPNLFLGMNPGPFGMAQTGVPFGDVAKVRDFLKICEPVSPPLRQHPARPITGFDCTRSEVSGTRVWNWIESTFATKDAFFSRFWISNYCPLVFMSKTGSNITPDKLPASQQQALFAVCDEALQATCHALHTKTLIGIGAFATKRAQSATGNTSINVVKILHPSPASPAANRGWAEQVSKQLREAGLL